MNIVQPSSIARAMKSYQLAGLEWMIQLYDYKAGGILADEMGLGKTVQSISLLAYLKQIRRIDGPHLIVVPLSTLGNWHEEIRMWCPELRVCKFYGRRSVRERMITGGILDMQQSDILLTTFETTISAAEPFCNVQWCVVIVDEGRSARHTTHNTLHTTHHTRTPAATTVVLRAACCSALLVLSSSSLEERNDEAVQHHAEPPLSVSSSAHRYSDTEQPA
jgi:SNF2 family DNA or RNA helicase